jgi:RNase adaptor protein for sRNA GlmZ degradation
MKRIIQFSFKYHGGNPCAGDSVPMIDCRIIPNPWRRNDNATDAERIAKVRQDPLFEELVLAGVNLLRRCDRIAVGCLFGKHRSGAVAAEIARRTGAVVENLMEKG